MSGAGCQSCGSFNRRSDVLQVVVAELVRVRTSPHDAFNACEFNRGGSEFSRIRQPQKEMPVKGQRKKKTDSHWRIATRVRFCLKTERTKTSRHRSRRR